MLLLKVLSANFSLMTLCTIIDTQGMFEATYCIQGSLVPMMVMLQ
jgi:hypothetical protein